MGTVTNTKYILVFEDKGKYILAANWKNSKIQAFASIEAAMISFKSILAQYLSSNKKIAEETEKALILHNPTLIDVEGVPAESFRQYITEKTGLIHHYNTGIYFEGAPVSPEIFKGRETISIYKEIARITGREDPVDVLMGTIPPQV